MAILRRHLTRLRVALFYFLLAIFSLTACVPDTLSIPEAAAQEDTIVSATATKCRFPVSEEQEIQCIDLEVPEEYGRPQGRWIRLHVAIISSSSKAPKPDPLLILYGGPGAHALDRVDKTLERFAQVLAVRDIILFDQRGIGYSLPSLNCPELDNFDVLVIDEQLDDTQEFERRLMTYGACRDRLMASGINLHDYSAETLAADVASLRQALGYETWNLYGVSYGAHQALTLMRDYPEGLRSVVLDSVYPLDVDLAKETTVTQDYALDMLFSANEKLHPGFEERFFDLVQELDIVPIKVPALIPDRWNYPYKTFNGDDLLGLMISIIARWPQSFPHMPGFIDDISDGNYVDLMELTRPSVGDQLFSEGMNLSVMCQEIDPAIRYLNISTVVPVNKRIQEYAQTDMRQRVELCQLWLSGDWHIRRQEQVTSSIPTLILRGGKDARIPVSWDTQATKGLANDFRLSYPETGHGVVTSNPCAGEAVTEFLSNPTVVPEISCGN